MPPASRRWRRVLALFDELAARYGYELIMTPVFEATELFARGVGEATEIVEKQMYTWDDKAGRSMTLRPEATASVVRAYLNAGGRRVAKYAYSGPMFRYEQPQAGRRRQFWQVGVEYLGEDSPLADVEVIELGYRFYVECGIEDMAVQLNSIGDAASRAEYRSLLTEFLEARRGDLSTEAQRRIATNPLRVLDSKADADKLEGAPVPSQHLSDESARHYAAVKEGLTAAGIPFQETPRLVRGLDYYTRTVFEYTARSYDAAQDSLGGGGRYDGLAEQLGGPAVPAVGFSLGIDRVVLALGAAAEPPPLDAFVIVADEESRPEASSLLAELRRGGVKADALAGVASVTAQFKAADRRDAAYAVVVGAQPDKVTVRLMADGSEEMIESSQVVAWLTR
jgi:histidyl-tRNA synthetase